LEEIGVVKMPDLTRRSFLGGALAVAGASVVPVSALFATVPRIVGDGIYDDWAGLQAALNGEPFIADDMVVRDATTVFLKSGAYRLTHKLVIDNKVSLIGEGIPVKQDSMPWLIADHDEDCAIQVKSSAVDCLLEQIGIRMKNMKNSSTGFFIEIG
jgi:hypothetical protein